VVFEILISGHSRTGSLIPEDRHGLLWGKVGRSVVRCWFCSAQGNSEMCLNVAWLEQSLSIHPLFPRNLAKIFLLNSWKGAAPPAAQHILLALGREKEEVSVRISQCLKTLGTWLCGRRRGQRRGKSKGKTS